MVRGTFSPARALRPAVVARLARTLGRIATDTLESLFQMLVLAALLIFLTGCAHSYLGERYILIRLFKHGNLPKLLGGMEFTQGTLRFAWHVTTVAWWALALLLVLAHRGPLSTASVLNVIAGAALATAVLPIFFTRGKHLSWVVFLLVAALVAFAA